MDIYIYMDNNNGMITDWINGLQMGWIILITIKNDNGMIYCIYLLISIPFLIPFNIYNDYNGHIYTGIV